MNAFVRRVTQDIAESISWMPNGRGGRYESVDLVVLWV